MHRQQRRSEFVIALIVSSLLPLSALAQEAMASAKAGASPMDLPAKPDADMKKVLETLKSLGGKPIEQLNAAEARIQPTPRDAVKALLATQGKGASTEGVRIKDSTYQTAGATLPLRTYTPTAAASASALPLIVYFHGGGWVIGSIDAYESSAVALAIKAQAVVVSVEYRLAPEHKLPAAYDDAFAAYQFVSRNAATFGGDPRRIAVAGESAGGNLAANVSIMARDKGVALPIYQVLIYPVAGMDMSTPSYLENADAQPLSKAAMNWFMENALVGTDARNSMVNLVSARLKGLPPTTLITADIDPLRSEGKTLADNLENAGVKVSYKNYEGVTHEFFGMADVVADAVAAENFVAAQLRSAFSEGS